MQKYFNYVQNTHGDAIQGASVAVTITSSGATATIYSDDGVTTTTNPLTTDENGYFAFYAADNNYTLTISGNGITTSVITNVSLVSYSENTWIPSIGGNATYSVQAGFYTKRGRSVTVTGQILINAIGTGSTGTITGLPFTAIGGCDTAITVGYFTGSATNYATISGLIGSSSTSIILSAVAAGGAASVTFPAVFFQNGANIVFSATYFTT
jgi:hypothetical protein